VVARAVDGVTGRHLKPSGILPRAIAHLIAVAAGQADGAGSADQGLGDSKLSSARINCVG
jgi:hypothetical protein